MRDVAWRTGLTLTALCLLVILGPGISCGSGHRLVEQIMGQTPQAQISTYLTAIARNDRQAALDAWTNSASSNTELQVRRELVTDALLASGPQIEYRILDIKWYRTCCEPARIQDPDQAGGASIRVSIKGQNLPETIHVFDILVPGGYWGDAMGNPIRHWAIVDVYPETEAPLGWTVREW
jgi:hypothetical protein